MPALNRGFASLPAQSHRHVGNRWSLCDTFHAFNSGTAIANSRSDARRMNRSSGLHGRWPRHVAGWTLLAMFACAKDDKPGAGISQTVATSVGVDSTPVVSMTIDSQAQ